MFKKVSYLASVSVVAATLMSSASYAVLEKELIEEIHNFYVQRNKANELKAKKNSPILERKEEKEEKEEKKEEKKVSPILEKKEEPSYGLMLFNGVSTLIKPATFLVEKTLHSIRFGGDKLRKASKDDKFFGFCAEKLNKSISGYTGETGKEVIKIVTTEDSFFSKATSLSGNFLRGFAQKGLELLGKQGETPKLSRTLREFWLKQQEETEEIFVSTSCALLLYPGFSQTSEAKKEYFRFYECWNESSRTVRTDSKKLGEFFVKGGLRFYIKKNLQLDNEILPFSNFCNALGVTYKDFPEIVDATTPEKLIPNDKERSELTTGAIEARQQTARIEMFQEFVKTAYEKEMLSHKTNIFLKGVLLQLEDGNDKKILAIEAPKDENKENDNQNQQNKTGKEEEKSEINDIN